MPSLSVSPTCVSWKRVGLLNPLSIEQENTLRKRGLRSKNEKKRENAELRRWPPPVFSFARYIDNNGI